MRTRSTLPESREPNDAAPPWKVQDRGRVRGELARRRVQSVTASAARQTAPSIAQPATSQAWHSPDEDSPES